MKKELFICLIGTTLLFTAISCGSKITPTAPPSNNAVYKAKDLPAPQSICIIQGGGTGEFPVVGETDCRGCGGPPGFGSGPAIVNQAASQPDTISGTGHLIDCIGVSGGCCFIGSVTSYISGTGTYSRPFTIPADVSGPVTITVSVSSGQSSATASINGFTVVSNGTCSGVYDLNNPPTTGCLAGVPLHLGNNTLTVTDQYLSGTQSQCPGTTYSLCYSYFGSAPSPTATPSNTPTNTPTGTLSPSATPTLTNSPTTTPTDTQTQTQTTTPTDTLTPTTSPTPSESITTTPSASPSASITPSVSTTPSTSETPNQSKTPQTTPSGTPNQTATPGVSPTPTCPGSSYVGQNITAYSQFDPRWQGDPMDHCTPGPVTLSGGSVFNDPHTIHSDGCFMTDFSMFSGQNPAQYDSTATANGRINQQTGNFDYTMAANDLGMTVTGTVTGATTDDLANSLSQDRYAIAALQHDNGREHYVLVTGAAVNPRTHQCDFNIVDPAGHFNFLSDYEAVSGSRHAVLDMITDIQ
jgi:hypothetical protein